MGKIPSALRKAIAYNIRECRNKKYPGRGGAKQCALEFGVKPQQWSPWECGRRTPDEVRLREIATFFGVTVEDLRRARSDRPPTNVPTPPANPAEHLEAIREYCHSIVANGITVHLDRDSIERIAERVSQKLK